MLSSHRIRSRPRRQGSTNGTRQQQHFVILPYRNHLKNIIHETFRAESTRACIPASFLACIFGVDGGTKLKRRQQRGKICVIMLKASCLCCRQAGLLAVATGIVASYGRKHTQRKGAQRLSSHVSTLPYGPKKHKISNLKHVLGVRSMYPVGQPVGCCGHEGTWFEARSRCGYIAGYRTKARDCTALVDSLYPPPAAVPF